MSATFASVPTIPLSPAERAQVARLADLLIPRSADMPSGSDADAHGEQLDRVFGVRPDLVDAVRAGLAHLPDPLPSSVGEIDAATFAELRPVADAITAAYFVNPAVAAKVGYTKRSAIPIRFDDDLDTLVTAVIGRGPIYRPTPAPGPLSAPEEN